MKNTIAFTRRRCRRLAITAVALWLGVGLSATVSATPATLQDLFDNPAGFIQDGLTFENFQPVLGASLPSGSELVDMLMTDPAALFSIAWLDFSPAAQFSQGWNTAAADASNIGVSILADKAATPGVDPGFKLHSGAEWSVSTTNNAAAQLSAFAYTVISPDPNINSAEILQTSTIDAVGPDCGATDPLWVTCLPFGTRIPDVAGGFALQLIIDSLGNEFMNYTMNHGMQTVAGVIPIPLLPLQPYDWSGFAGVDEIFVVNVVGVGATSGGGFTLNALEQRIDPPAGGALVPLPGTLFLFGIGLAGMGLRLRRVTFQNALPG